MIQVDIILSEKGYKCVPSKVKVKKWQSAINAAQAEQRLLPGCASKLAGKLSWGTSKLFRRLGRAMLRPIFDQKTRRDGEVSPELSRALEWWDEVLEKQVAELRDWNEEYSPPVHLFCDASGQPPYLGAVVFMEGKCWYTHMTVPDKLLERFVRRSDNQIMGLELLSISLGLSTFEDKLRGRRIVVHSDNKGSEVCGHVQNEEPVDVIMCLCTGRHKERERQKNGSCTISARAMVACGSRPYAIIYTKSGDRRQHCWFAIKKGMCSQFQLITACIMCIV